MIYTQCPVHLLLANHPPPHSPASWSCAAGTELHLVSTPSESHQRSPLCGQLRHFEASFIPSVSQWLQLHPGGRCPHIAHSRLHWLPNCPMMADFLKCPRRACWPGLHFLLRCVKLPSPAPLQPLWLFHSTVTLPLPWDCFFNHLPVTVLKKTSILPPSSNVSFTGAWLFTGTQQS